MHRDHYHVAQNIKNKEWESEVSFFKLLFILSSNQLLKFIKRVLKLFERKLRV